MQQRVNPRLCVMLEITFDFVAMRNGGKLLLQPNCNHPRNALFDRFQSGQYEKPQPLENNSKDLLSLTVIELCRNFQFGKHVGGDLS